MRRSLSILFSLGVTLASAQFKNIKLAEQKEDAFPPLEPSITINLKNSANIIAGIGANRIKNSSDGGITWSEIIPTSPHGVLGDPTLISDVKGDLYYFHLSDPKGEGSNGDSYMDRIVCQKSEDGGKQWNEGSSLGISPTKDHGKPGVVVHPRKQILYAAWTQFDKFGLKDPNCHSNILFSMSTNGGDKWTKPVQINQTPGNCLGNENTAEGAFPAVGLDGRIYVTWANQGIIFLDRSYDGGVTWLTNDIGVTKQTQGPLLIPGFSQTPVTPVMIIDYSMTRRQGYMYMVFAHQGKDTGNTDVFMIRSLDRGDHWTMPEKVNSDTTRTHQFMPSMAVDQSNGNVYVVYYDRRAYEDLQTDVYLAYSFDGGSSFKEVKISESPFTPSGKQPPGEYISISAHGGIVTPIWTRFEEGQASVWTTVIKEDMLTK